MTQKSKANQLPLLDENLVSNPESFSPAVQAMIARNKQDREQGVKPYPVPLPFVQEGEE